MNLETEMNKLSDRLNEYRHEGKQKLLGEWARPVYVLF